MLFFFTYFLLPFFLYSFVKKQRTDRNKREKNKQPSTNCCFPRPIDQADVIVTTRPKFYFKCEKNLLFFKWANE